MDLDTFLKSFADPSPPAGLRGNLQALWHDAKGDWNRAHEIVQSDEGVEAAWVHAYLHRKEGDLSNADYWYRRAKRKRPAGTLEKERDAIAAELLLPK